MAGLFTKIILVCCLAALSRGIVAARIRDRASWIPAIGAPLTVHPFDSDLWWGEGTNDSRVVTFRNFYFRGTTNDPVNAQVRLYPSGRIEVCSNDVMTAYGRIEPFDLDCDGLANAIDPHPFVSDGNCYGQGENWVRACFTNLQGVAEGLTNVQQILDVGYANWVDAQVGEGLANGLYKFTVTFPEAPVRPTLLTVGDASVVVTNAGTYVFLLEMLEEYEVGLEPYAEEVEFSWTDVVGSTSSPRMLARPPETDWDVRYELNAYVYDEGYEVWVRPSKRSKGLISIVPRLGIAPTHQEFDDTGIPDPLVFVASLNVSRSASVNYTWTKQPSGEVVSNDALLSEEGLLGVDWIEVEASCKGHTWRGSVDVRRRVRTPDLRLRGPGLIICEDAYTNRPGEVVAASSTAAALEAAWAVRSAGTLTLSSADAGFVVREDGADTPIVLPYSWRVNGEEFGSRRFWVEKTSGTAVGATGAFTLDYEPDIPGEELTASAEVTVVKIKVEAVETWPENRVRHIFGPKEEVTISFEPTLAELSFTGELRDHGSVKHGESFWRLTAPDQPGVFEVPFTCGGEAIGLAFATIAPEAITGVDIRRFEEYDWFEVGMTEFPPAFAGVVAYVTTAILPDCVSFKGVRLYETYAPAVDRQGWYADTNMFPNVLMSHNIVAGASSDPSVEYMEVWEEGKIDPGDRIGAWIGNLTAYSNGSYRVEIPVKWYTVGCSVTNDLAHKNMQVVKVRSDGRMTVSKFGLGWERQLYNGFEYPVNMNEEDE